ncbi:Catabolite control protein A [Carnimonas sp. R-84981]|uniref:LacI family DNA-binding transcriptional regulator n=1 Tax=Carnimonas bestiolae TaxID=3402172 RepID=UPI003EDC5FBE
MKNIHRLPTSTDVAQLAGVSQSAVSRTFSRRGSVSPATRAKVLAAADRLGYRPNALPAIMQGQRSQMIALVTGRMHNPFYARVLQALTNTLQQHGQQVLVSCVDSDHALDAALNQSMRYRVDAIVSALAVITPAAAASFSRTGIPVVAFNNVQNAPGISSVNSDNESAGRQAAAHLLAQKCQRLGFIHGPSDSPAAQQRWQGFSGYLAKRGISDIATAHGDFSYQSGAEAVARLWRTGMGPEGVFCANDLMALGAMDTLRQTLGVRIPEDVAVVGYDNIDASGWGAYQLSSFDQDIDAMANETLAILEHYRSSDQSMLRKVPARLVIRASSAFSG